MEFDSVLREYNPVNYKKLEEALPKARIEEFMEEFNVEDETYRALYLWKNGADLPSSDNAVCQIVLFG